MHSNDYTRIMKVYDIKILIKIIYKPLFLVQRYNLSGLHVAWMSKMWVIVFYDAIFVSRLLF